MPIFSSSANPSTCKNVGKVSPTHFSFAILNNHSPTNVEKAFKVKSIHNVLNNNIMQNGVSWSGKARQKLDRY